PADQPQHRRHKGKSPGQQELGAVERQHHRNAEQPRGREAPDAVRERPMHVQRIEALGAAEPQQPDQPKQDVERRDEQIERIADAVRRALAVRQVLPAPREIAEAMDRDALHRMTWATFVARCKNPDLMPAGDELARALDQKRGVSVRLRQRVDRGDDADLHGAGLSASSSGIGLGGPRSHRLNSSARPRASATAPTPSIIPHSTQPGTQIAVRRPAQIAATARMTAPAPSQMATQRKNNNARSRKLRNVLTATAPAMPAGMRASPYLDLPDCRRCQRVSTSFTRQPRRTSMAMRNRCQSG